MATFDPDTGKLTVTKDLPVVKQLGTYQIKISVTIENGQYVLVKYTEFNLNLVDPCPSATVSLKDGSSLGD